LKCKPERFKKRKNKKKRERSRRSGSSEEPGCASVNLLKLMTAMIVPANIAAISTQADF